MSSPPAGLRPTGKQPTVPGDRAVFRPAVPVALSRDRAGTRGGEPLELAHSDRETSDEVAMQIDRVLRLLVFVGIRIPSRIAAHQEPPWRDLDEPEQVAGGQ